MRSISPGLQAFLDTATTATFRHLITITLASGTVLRWTDHSEDITLPGNTWVAGGTGTVPLLQVGNRRDPAGTEIGECDLTLFAGETAELAGVRLPLAVVNDSLDGAKVKIERVYGPDIIDLTLGTMHLFEGMVAEVEPSSTQVVLSLVDAREGLRVKLPKTSIQPPCGALLFDGQCSLSEPAWTVVGTVAAGGDARFVRTNRTEADDYFTLGIITFTSGANQGVKRAIRSFKNANGEFELDEALPTVPAVGDTFSVYPGCDKRRTTCETKFSNLTHFRGFPLLPADATDTRARWGGGYPYGELQPTGWNGIGNNVTPPDLTLPLVYGRGKVRGQVVYRYGPFSMFSLGNLTCQVIALAEGPIVGTRRCWIGSSFYQTIPLVAQGLMIDQGSDYADVIRLGSRPTQDPWRTVVLRDPEYGGVTYPGVAYWGAGWRSIPYGSAETYEIEVDGFLSNAADAHPGTGDAHPASIIADATYGLLPNAAFGAGFSWPVVTDVGPDGTADSSARRYLTAAGIYLSPVLSQPRETIEILQELLDSSNCSCRMSDGTLEIIPLGDVAFTANGVTYTPDTTVQYAFTEAHLLADGDDPVSVKRPGREEVFNIVPVEFVERGADLSADSAYNTRSVEGPEPVDVATHGPRRGGAVSMPMISLPEVALTISRLRAQQAVKRRNTYTFRVGYRYAPLEPLDYISLSDARFGLSNRVVRVKSIEEDADGTLTIEAEDAPLGMSHAVAHPVQSSESSFVGKPWASTDVAVAAQTTESWSHAYTPIQYGYLEGICWSGARWVVVGKLSACGTTEDPTGQTGWTVRSVPGGDYYAAASNGSGTVVAVGTGGAGMISTDDGATWSASTLPAGDYYDVIRDAAHSLWVAVGKGVCATSPSGTAGTWTARTIPFTSATFNSVASNGSALAAVGSAAGVGGYAIASNDGGITWTSSTTIPSSYLKGVTALGSRFIATGISSGLAFASDDNGATWQQMSVPPINLTCIGSDGLILVGFGTHANPPAAAGGISTDRGLTWAPIMVPQPTTRARSYKRVAYNGYVWAAVAEDAGGNFVTVSRPAGGGNLAGDLTGNIASPTIASSAVTTAKIADASVTSAKLAPGAVFPNYSNGVAQSTNTVYQAPSAGWVAVFADGAYKNSFSVYAGNTNPPTQHLGTFGDDLNSNTKDVAFLFPVAAGTYYKVNSPGNAIGGNNSPVYGFETVWVSWFAVTG